jgi:hypothetical protein
MKDQTSAESHKRDLDEKERKASIIKISGFKTIAEIELLLSNGEKETFVVDYDKSMSAWNQSDNISLIQSKYKKGEDSQAHVEYLINHTNGDIITCNALLSDDSELTIEALSQRFNLPVKKTRLTAWTPNIPIIIGCALYFMIINKFSADINWSVIVNEHGRNSFLVCLGMIVMLPANVIIMQKLNIRFAIVNNYNILKSIHSNCATSLKAAIIGINK